MMSKIFLFIAILSLVGCNKNKIIENNEDEEFAMPDDSPEQFRLDTGEITKYGRVYYWDVDEYPEFGEGENALREYMNSALDNSMQEEPNICIRNQVRFIVLSDGSLTVLTFRSITATGESDDSLKDIFVQIIENMPKWKPAKKNGENVNMECGIEMFVGKDCPPRDWRYQRE